MGGATLPDGRYAYRMSTRLGEDQSAATCRDTPRIGSHA
ncbi:hypothetical protein JOF44_001479 [Brachybacterium fresconis]|uniref:Uncharacterized protein n=1 Tax=Brachybacterium fresconis TaxID=173363 RepID=A0ABS4YIJ5_9MICO|nr:hypothetical protein [Brachybacterium fresconis]